MKNRTIKFHVEHKKSGGSEVFTTTDLKELKSKIDSHIYDLLIGETQTHDIGWLDMSVGKEPSSMDKFSIQWVAEYPQEYADFHDHHPVHHAEKK